MARKSIKTFRCYTSFNVFASYLTCLYRMAENTRFMLPRNREFHRKNLHRSTRYSSEFFHFAQSNFQPINLCKFNKNLPRVGAIMKLSRSFSHTHTHTHTRACFLLMHFLCNNTPTFLDYIAQRPLFPEISCKLS